MERMDGRRLLLAGMAATALLMAGVAAASERNVSQAPMAAMDLRLASIGYRIASDNSDRCAAPEMLTGMLVHDLASYDLRDRPRVTARFALRDGFGIRAVVAGSAADRAGIRAGDEVVQVDALNMRAFEQRLVGSKASYERTEAFEALLDQRLVAGPVAVTVRRGDATLTLHLAADRGCGGKFVVVPGNAFNAWSDGSYVAVTSGLMATITDDAELAFVVAHEMSHNILRHSARLKGTSNILAELGIGAGKVKATEVEADSFAVRLLARAGYDLGGPARFLERAAAKRPFDLALTHPGIRRRIEIVNGAIAQLHANEPAIVQTAALAAPQIELVGIPSGNAGSPANAPAEKPAPGAQIIAATPGR